MNHDGPQIHPRVLAIDGSKGVRALYQAVLADEGYEALTMDCEEASVAAIAAARPDVIVLDCLFACTNNAWSLLRLLEADSVLRQVPVVLCTTDSRLVQEEGECLRAAGYEVLQKPFDLDVLLSTIERACLAIDIGAGIDE